jgi:hypothetical protein
MSTSRDLLRHLVATIAYRGSKALRGAPAEFAAFRPCDDGRSAGELLAHICDLMEWSAASAREKAAWREESLASWELGIGRFHAGLAALDQALAIDAPLAMSEEKMLQGPVGDALTHVGQIVLMRRMAGAPMKSEPYFIAEVAAGRVGPDQPAPRKEW